MMNCGRGGIGRRAGFRYQWRESWGFESLRPHQLINNWESRSREAICQSAGDIAVIRYEDVKSAQVRQCRAKSLV